MRTPLVAGNWKMNGTRRSVAGLCVTWSQGAISSRRGGISLSAIYFYDSSVQSL